MTHEQYVKFVQSAILVSLLLTLNILYSVSYCLINYLLLTLNITKTKKTLFAKIYSNMQEYVLESASLQF